MKLEGSRRLEVHVPTELWEEVEKARGQMTRSEFTRQALRAQIDYPPMLASPMIVSEPRVKTDVSEARPKTAREILQERTRLLREGKKLPDENVQ